MTTVLALVIPTDQRRKAYLRPVEVDQINRIVDGYLEMVRLSSRSHMYVNDDGKSRGLPYNITATRLLRFSPLGEALVENGDFVAGTAIVLGSHMAPEEGPVRAEVMTWCDSAGIAVIREVAGMPVPGRG